MSLEPILARLAEIIGEKTELLTLDELEASSRSLAARFPGEVRVEEIGRSTGGRPIELLTIGRGRRHALLVGVPHPNEPIGTLTLEALAELFAANAELIRPLDFTFSLIKAADPDGLKLNEGWLKGRFQLVRYALEYYRSPPNEQVEWGFPIRYKTLRFDASPPETRAVMAAIERLKPDLLYSLHNASFCGVYFYASRRVDPLFAGLASLIERESLPIHRGEPEVPYVRPYADGMYPLFGVKETYDYLEKHTQDDPARHINSGASSHEYLVRMSPHAFSLVSELPYITDPALDDHRPTSISRRDAMAEGLRRTEETLKEVESHMRMLALDASDPRWADDRIYRAVADWLARTPKRIAMQKQAILSTGYSAKATRAQAFDAMVCKSFHAVLVLGETQRLAAAAGDESRADEIRARVEARIARIEEESHLVVLDLARLVRVQASALLLALECL